MNTTCDDDVLTEILVNASTKTIGLNLVIQMSYRLMCNLTSGYDCDVNESYVALSARCFTKEQFDAADFTTSGAKATVGILLLLILFSVVSSIVLFFHRRMNKAPYGPCWIPSALLTLFTALVLFESITSLVSVKRFDVVVEKKDNAEGGG